MLELFIFPLIVLGLLFLYMFSAINIKLFGQFGDFAQVNISDKTHHDKFIFSAYQK